MKKMLTNVARTMIMLGVACVPVWLAAAEGPSTSPATVPAKELSLDAASKVTLKLVRIPAGKFLMGSPASEKERDSDEAQHEVTISKPFYMGATHVTVDQFAAFAKSSGYKTESERAGGAKGFEINNGNFEFKMQPGRSWRNPGFEQKGDHPVVFVSWNDARAFCTWLSRKSRKTVLLPTEAQWEYACRAGTQTEYPWGETADEGKGWLNAADQSLKKVVPGIRWPGLNWEDGYVFTSPGASFKANAFGLYDMTGNAWHWVQDQDSAYPTSAVRDPMGGSGGNVRIIRGACWRDNAKMCRSADRRRLAPGTHNDSSGFRVVVVAAGLD